MGSLLTLGRRNYRPTEQRQLYRHVSCPPIEGPPAFRGDWLGHPATPVATTLVQSDLEIAPAKSGEHVVEVRPFTRHDEQVGP